MIRIFAMIPALALLACADGAAERHTFSETPAPIKRYRGAVSNGMKGDSLFFEISADGRQLQKLTFKGYWRCSGKLEQTTVGPDGRFAIIGGRAKGHLAEPPGGGSTAWRFEIDATINKKTAAGTFRMNINNLGCDTYLLKWTAATF
ncbi:MAG: hypothetical protein EOP50_21830 [Sphingobacteriales bacterium]|nr:MAG: hypothetical protein EOP50_21830 [Sphingobacteriales bacterium]